MLEGPQPREASVEGGGLVNSEVPRARAPVLRSILSRALADIFLTCAELFERIDALADEKEIQLTLSYLETYNETIRDLLVPGGSKLGLQLREDTNSNISVSGLSTHAPKTVEGVMDMIVLGNANRTQSPTEANATSSRSHAVLQINVTQKSRTAGLSEDHMVSTLSIIDLAGSERASVTKNRGDRLLGGANITRSLLAHQLALRPRTEEPRPIPRLETHAAAKVLARW